MANKDLIEAITAISDEIADQSGATININFDVEAYNMIASLWQELERSATALERIATALENK
jgi:hypothetical protein